MINQIYNKSENLKYESKEALSKMLKEELDATYNNIETKELKELSEKSLEIAKQWVIDKFNGDSNGTLTKLGQELNQEREKLSQEKQYKTTQLRKIEQEILKELNLGKNIKLHLNRVLSFLQGEGFIDYSSVESEIESFLIRNVSWHLKVGEKVFISDFQKRRMSGYYKEIIELKLLQNFFNNFHLNVKTKMIASANTISDLLLSTIDDLNKALEQNNYSVEEMISIVDNNTEQEFGGFGAQVKARDLMKVGTNFMKISHQAGLAKEFNSIQSEDFNKYSWACGVVFLGQKKNILQSLGPTNILFISGPHKYFMDEFIGTFRSRQMYLSFEMDDNHQATSQVGLQRYINQRRGAKKSLLDRFDQENLF